MREIQRRRVSLQAAKGGFCRFELVDWFDDEKNKSRKDVVLTRDSIGMQRKRNDLGTAREFWLIWSIRRWPCGWVIGG